jgi:hypothetical protein
MKKDAGICWRSSISRIRGNPVTAPYSPFDIGTGSGWFLESASLSMSNEKQTATRAPFGQAFGVSLRPARAIPAIR